MNNNTMLKKLQNKFWWKRLELKAFFSFLSPSISFERIIYKLPFLFLFYFWMQCEVLGTAFGPPWPTLLNKMKKLLLYKCNPLFRGVANSADISLTAATDWPTVTTWSVTTWSVTLHILFAFRSFGHMDVEWPTDDRPSVVGLWLR